MTNGAAIGYAIIAARRLGLNKEGLNRLEAEIIRAMGEIKEEEAEEAYKNS